MDNIEQRLLDLPTPTLVRSAIVLGIAKLGEIAAAFDRLATAQERIAQAMEDDL